MAENNESITTESKVTVKEESVTTHSESKVEPVKSDSSKGEDTPKESADAGSSSSARNPLSDNWKRQVGASAFDHGSKKVASAIERRKAEREEAEKNGKEGDKDDKEASKFSPGKDSKANPSSRIDERAERGRKIAERHNRGAAASPSAGASATPKKSDSKDSSSKTSGDSSKKDDTSKKDDSKSKESPDKKSEPGKKRVSAKDIKGLAGGLAANRARQAYAPKRVKKANGQNNVSANAAKSLGGSAAKGAVVGAIKGAAGGAAGMAAGAAKGAVAGASKGASKAARGAAEDMAENALSKKSKSESSGTIGKGTAVLAVFAFLIAMLTGTAGGTQQQQSQQAGGAGGANSCEAITTSDNSGYITPPIAAVSYVTPLTTASAPLIVPANESDNSLASLTPAQNKIAGTIIGMAKATGIGKLGALYGLQAAWTESNWQNYANSGNLESLALPHDAIGHDHDSVGVFQQRPTMNWGTTQDIMNPIYATQAFFFGVNEHRGLTQIKDWDTLPGQDVIQKVQGSYDPTGQNYAASLSQANKILAAMYDKTPTVTPLKDYKQLGNPGTVNVVDGAQPNNCDGAGAIPVVAGGGTGKNDYPAATAPYCRISAGCPWAYGIEAGYGVQCANGVAGGCRGECVDWAAWKTVQRLGKIGQKIAWGNAEDWPASARAVSGNVVDRTPAVGALVVWKTGEYGYSSPGHIASISKVNPDGSFDIEEYNYASSFTMQNATLDPTATGTPGRYHTRTIQPQQFSNILHINNIG